MGSFGSFWVFKGIAENGFVWQFLGFSSLLPQIIGGAVKL
jgi:hypothetical protein